jgi:hypothetical protein
MQVLAALMLAAVLVLTACASTPPSPTAATQTSEVTASPKPGGIDAAVTEFAERAQQNDTAYFRKLRGCETTESARFWIDRVNRADVLEYYRPLVETGPGPDEGRLDFHSRGHFLAGLESRNGVWRVCSLSP